MKEIINKIKKIKYLKLIILLILICFSSMIILELNSYLRNSKLEVVFLDIGQGDSILIKSPNYNNYLIDLGKSYTVSQEIYKNLFFWDNQIKALILTHPDLDHVGGFSSLNNLKIKNIFVSKGLKYDLDQNILDKNNLNLTEVDKSLVIQEQNTKSSSSLNLEFKILNPYNSSFTDDNNNSIVNTLNFGKMFFIFTGDIDSEMEKVLVSQGYFDGLEDKVVVLKVAHHGSKYSSSEFFLKKIKPDYCVISVGKDNDYGHPAKEALERLEKYCKNIWRTDIGGQISFKTNGFDLELSGGK